MTTFTKTILVPTPFQIINGVEVSQEPRLFSIMFTILSVSTSDTVEQYSVVYSLRNEEDKEFDHSGSFDQILFNVDTKNSIASIYRIETPLLDHWKYECYTDIIRGIEEFVRGKGATELIILEVPRSRVEIHTEEGFKIVAGKYLDSS